MTDQSGSTSRQYLENFEPSRTWWKWPLLVSMFAVVVVFGLLPGMNSLRNFERQNMTWLADQDRREQFRTETEKERLSLEKTISEQRSLLAELNAKAELAAELVRSQQPVLAQLEQSRKEIENIRQERTVALSLTDRLKKEQEELTRTVKSLESQRESLSSVVNDLKGLQAERDQIVKDLASISKSVTDTRAALSAMTEQLSASQSELSRISADRVSEEKKVALAKEQHQQLAGLDVTVQQRQQQADKLKSEVATLQTRIDGLRTSFEDELKQQLSARELYKREREAEVKRLSDSQDSVESEQSTVLLRQQTQLKQINTDIENASGILTGLRDQEKALRQQLQRLAADQLAASKLVTDSRESIDNERGTLALRQQSQLKQTNIDIEAANVVLAGLREQEKELRKQIQMLSADQQAAVARINTFAPLLGDTFGEFNQQLKRMIEQMSRITPATSSIPSPQETPLEKK